MSKSSRKKLPVDPVAATIDSLSHDARGVAHVDGKAVFIDGTLPGEQVEFIYTKRKRKYDEARLNRLIEASPDRTEPQCQHFSICGGCSLQHLKPEKQIELKQNILLDNLRHIGHVEPETVLAPLTGPVWGYRHKARLGVKYVIKKQKLLVGFREKRNSYIAEINQCPVLHESAGKKIEALAHVINDVSIRDKVPQIEVAVSDDRTALVIRHLEPFNENDKQLLGELAEKHGFLIYLQPGGLDTVAPLQESDTETYLHYSLPDYDIEMEFKPTQFTQVNTEINRKMIKQALEHLEAENSDHILDLFCGMGNFTLPVARSGATVTGIEGNKELIELARANARKNAIENVAFKTIDLFDETKNAEWNKLDYNKLLLDPPRSGALNVVENLDQNKARKIVYVSCNPSTLARDADILVNTKKYKLKQAGVMDMFPHTSHVEAIAVFEK